MAYGTHIAELQAAVELAAMHERKAAQAASAKGAADERLIANLYRQIAARLQDGANMTTGQEKDGQAQKESAPDARPGLKLVTPFLGS